RGVGDGLAQLGEERIVIGRRGQGLVVEGVVGRAPAGRVGLLAGRAVRDRLVDRLGLLAGRLPGRLAVDGRVPRAPAGARAATGAAAGVARLDRLGARDAGGGLR